MEIISIQRSGAWSYWSEASVVTVQDLRMAHMLDLAVPALGQTQEESASMESAAMTTDKRASSDSWSESTSPSTSPSAALSICPRMERRSVSAASSASSVSVTSTGGTQDSISGSMGRRRGYNRPQATAFSDSARQRDSVSCLGTIAHLQFYFARTGLLDGKGGQLAKDDPQGSRVGSRSASGTSQASPRSASFSMYDSSLDASLHIPTPDGTAYDDCSIVSSPEQSPFDEGWESPHPLALPPTVSTYKPKSTYIPPPPSLSVLRRELRETLQDAKKLLQDVELDAKERGLDANSPSKASDNAGWFEIQGLQVLDLLTLAIRAARNYYTSHEKCSRLYLIRSERQIRTELFTTLEVLKKMANRNFAGGVRPQERSQISKWIFNIDELVTKDEEAENLENEQMRKHEWQEPIWEGRERQRELLFLKSFDTGSEPLPEWTAPSNDDSKPTAFLDALQDGRRLAQLHNELVKRSRRHFEAIKTYHMDVGKPYRRTENLQFWIKAAEIRWEAKLQVDIPGIVRGDSAAAWLGFDAALIQWSKTVREGITQEWQTHADALKKEQPIVRIDLNNDVTTAW